MTVWFSREGRALDLRLAGFMGLLTITARAQAIYFILTGVWPLVHMPSFLAVTGPKTDLWLVDTVGVLVIAIGIGLWMASRQGPHSVAASLGLASAVGLAAIDVIFGARRTIPPVYLVDAGIQAIWILAWCIVLATNPRERVTS